MCAEKNTPSDDAEAEGVISGLRGFVVGDGVRILGRRTRHRTGRIVRIVGDTYYVDVTHTYRPRKLRGVTQAILVLRVNDIALL